MRIKTSDITPKKIESILKDLWCNYNTNAGKVFFEIKELFPNETLSVHSWREQDYAHLDDEEIVIYINENQFHSQIKIIVNYNVLFCPAGFNYDNPHNRIIISSECNHYRFSSSNDLYWTSIDEYEAEPITAIHMLKEYCAGKLCVMKAFFVEDPYWAPQLIIPSKSVTELKYNELLSLFDLRTIVGSPIEPKDISMIKVSFWDKSFDYCVLPY